MGHRSFANVLVHLVWATSHRQPILTSEHDAWLARELSRKGFGAGGQVFAIGIASDHVHMAVRLGVTTPMSELLQRVKGTSSRLWNLTRSPRLTWQDGYWAESIRPEDLRGLCGYLGTQRQHHRSDGVLEGWMTRFDEPCPEEL